MAQLSAAIDGIAEACTALGTPITGGNVSLYNETKGEGIYPTPVIGIVGIIEDVTKAVPADFQHAGDAVLLIGSGRFSTIEQAHLQNSVPRSSPRAVLGKIWGTPPRLRSRTRKLRCNKCSCRACASGLIHSARDISDGGIAVAFAKHAFATDIGVDVDICKRTRCGRDVASLWRDAQRVVSSLCSRDVARRSRSFGDAEVRHRELRWQYGRGSYTGRAARDSAVDGDGHRSTTSPNCKSAWSNALQSTLSVDTVTA